MTLFRVCVSLVWEYTETCTKITGIR